MYSNSPDIFRDLLRFSSQALLLVDMKEQKLLGWNEYSAKFCSSSPKQGMMLTEILPGLDLGTLKADFQKPGEDWLFLSRIEDGLPSEIAGLCVRISSYDPTSGLGILQVRRDDPWDILRHFHSSSEAFDSSSQKMAIMALDGTILTCNRAFSSFWDKDKEYLQGVKLDQVVEDCTGVIFRTLTSCRDDKEIHTGQDILTVYGKEHFVHYYIRPMPAVLGWDETALVILTDFTHIYSDIRKLQHQEQLLQSVSRIARKLLFDTTDFDTTINEILSDLGMVTGVDRVYIWSIHDSPCPEKDSGLYTSQQYEWSDGADPQQGTELCTNRPVSEACPTWIDTFNAHRCINSLVRDMPQKEQEQLSPQGIISILVTPIFIEGELKGFIGFDDCHDERVWSQNEVSILKSVGRLISLAIQQRKVKEELIASQTRFLHVQNASGEVIWSLDSNECFDYVSNRVTVYLGYTPEEIYGKPALSFFADAGEFYRWRPTPENPVVHELIQEYRTKSGEVKKFRTSCQYIFDADGHVEKVHGCSADVSELYEANERLQEANEKLERLNSQLMQEIEKANILTEAAQKADKAKSAFLANMSHEIRTPLNAIVGMTAIGKRSASPERKQIFEKIEDASAHLLGVINNVLDLAKIESGMMELVQKNFDIKASLQRIADMHSFAMQVKEMDFHLSIDPTIPQYLLGDEQRLAQVVTNLLSNAIKFTPERKKVSLEARLLEENADTCTLQITVRDEGIGIRSDAKKSLFQPFQQAEQDTSRKFGGTGLGLSISKRIVEMMKGRIWYESEPAKGTDFHFTVRLPHKVMDDRVDPSHGSAMPDSLEDIFQGRTILLAEDVEINREILIALLEETSIGIDCAENGQQAIDLFRTHSERYDLILMDIQMPEVDGLEATRQIRALDVPMAGSIPIIALTANVFREDIERYLKAGMDDHLGKPLDMNKVLSLLYRYLGKA